MPDTTTPSLPTTPIPTYTPAAADDGPPWTGMTAEIMDDWYWYFEEIEKGTFDVYAGNFIAILGRKVVAHGPDAIAMSYELPEKLGVPARRLVLPYIHDFEAELFGR